MRYLAPLLIGLAAGSCAYGPPSPEQTAAYAARHQAKLAELTAGKVAGPPMACMSTYHQNDMVVIDDSTVAFRDGRRRVYVNHLNGGCANLGSGTNALVTRTISTQLCRGDIAQVFDTSTRMLVGACSFGDFIPYTAPGYRG